MTPAQSRALANTRAFSSTRAFNCMPCLRLSWHVMQRSSHQLLPRKSFPRLASAQITIAQLFMSSKQHFAAHLASARPCRLGDAGHISLLGADTIKTSQQQILVTSQLSIPHGDRSNALFAIYSGNEQAFVGQLDTNVPNSAGNGVTPAFPVNFMLLTGGYHWRGSRSLAVAEWLVSPQPGCPESGLFSPAPLTAT